MEVSQCRQSPRLCPFVSHETNTRQVSASLPSLVSYWPRLPEYANKVYDMSYSANHIDLTSAAQTYSVVEVQPGLTLCRGIQIFTGTKCSGKAV